MKEKNSYVENLSSLNDTNEGWQWIATINAPELFNIPIPVN